jgi:hypothetical protein
MDKALEKFGNDIAIAFRLIIFNMLLNGFGVWNLVIELLFVLGFLDHGSAFRLIIVSMLLNDFVIECV